MTDLEGIPWDDATTAPFWEGAFRRELLVQRCRDCEATQLYARPYCIACQSDALEWVATSGEGTVHSQTTVHLPTIPELVPPYTVALVDLDAGPRILANVVGESSIGDRMRVRWREREGAPPMYEFERLR